VADEPVVVTPPETDPGPSVALSPVPRINFLNAMRGLAVALVLWDHLVSYWPTATGFGYKPQVWAARWFFTPLGITQDGGFLGVGIFFLVSGFIVTRVAERETLPRFALRRVLRIVPPLAVVVLVSAWWHPVGLPSHAGWKDILSNITLVNYVMVHNVQLVGVGWTLIIEVIFYALVALLVSLCRLPPRFVLAIEAVVVWFVLISQRDHGPHWFLFSVSVSYLPLLFVGQAIHYWDSGKLRLREAIGAGVVLLGLWEWGVGRVYPQFLHPDQSYPISAAVALAIFVIALRAPSRFGSDRFSRYVADRSYAIYLVHGLVGFQALSVLHSHHWPFTLCLIGALLVTLACAELSWWVVERPSRTLAHRLTRRRVPS
jgi:peptidoglycan/LPS O-acetylase OafA/YrhL